jgi:hypothetical protein
MADNFPPEPSTDARPPLIRRIGRIVAQVDRFVVDGLVNACGFLIFAAAEGLRSMHHGKVQVTLLVAMAVLVATVIAVMLGLPNLFRGATLGGVIAC